MGLLSAISGRAFAAWDVLLVTGVLAGGWLAGGKSGTPHLSPLEPSAFLARFVGGLGLGAGASIAGGCTVGQGLTGLALLAPSSFAVMASIFTGSTVAALAGRRHQASCGASASSLEGGR